MCGIAGIIDLGSGSPITRDELRAMADAIRHRGPDSDGIALRDGVGLAFRRLSIIDVAGGDQPIHAREADAAIVFNGEIYNYLAIRAELESKGHRFETRSDTETVLRGYLEWGEEGMLARILGMFAFAIHDARRGRVILARDRLGKKPLHLVEHRGRLAFASEIKALLTDPTLPRELDERALLDYVTLGYVLRESSIYRGIEKLLPGHYAVVENGTVRRFRYWSAPFRLSGIDYREAVERTREAVRTAVARRLMSEVPLGCFLSGGVDSSLIAATMTATLGTDVNAITIGFDERGFDEREAAREVARHLGITPKEEVVLPDPAALDAVQETFDEPLADASAVPTWLLCRAARKRVTVALSGDGGDECFGGYRRYRYDLLENRLRSRLPEGARRGVFGALGRVWPKADYLPRPLRWKTLLENLALDPVEGYFRSVARVRPEDALALLAPEVRTALADYRPLDRFHALDRERRAFDPLARIRALDLETWLPDDILVKVDRASMANSLEVRAPLLDSELVEFASSLPAPYLIRGQSGKRVLKDVARSMLPAPIIDRKKHGFDLPVRAWLAGPLAHELDALSAARSPIARWFDLAVVRSMIEEHRRGTRDRTAECWMLVTFGRFVRRWLPGAA